MYIPEIGDAVTLAEDWTFPLQFESRNAALWEALGKPTPNRNQDYEYYMYRDERKPSIDRTAKWAAVGVRVDVVPDTAAGYYGYCRDQHVLRTDATLPKGSILTVDRIYIRKGIKEYSSVTFYVRNAGLPKTGKQHRFWVKLADVNTMVVEDALVPPVVKPPTKKKHRYYLWVRWTPEEIAHAQPMYGSTTGLTYLQERINAYNQGVRSYGGAGRSDWMDDPHYNHFGVTSVRSEADFIAWAQKKYGDRLKCVATTYYSPTGDQRIYEAP